ncbi:hypothetical protein CQW23_12731 [Capsicum baccatum]|uniref:Uncharacterized protein n=1 Tax=Capsicum baccatum TaxID=33114 RepID=A0A2G2WTG5_CAPBA|nr:hypothetical protein CQW23_12731 [Capsicum baccatum]
MMAPVTPPRQKPPEAFITRVNITQKTEDEEYAKAGEQSYSDSSVPVADSGVSSPASTTNAQRPAARQPAALLYFFFLLDLGMDNNNSASVSADQPATPYRECFQNAFM